MTSQPPIRVLFFGTPRFAVPTLAALHKTGYELLAVTNPDRPVGRRCEMTSPPVKEFAVQLGIRALQPQRLTPDVVAELRAWQPDVAVVAAYGKILKPDMLAVPKSGFLNVHPSLLPRHRGASPVIGTILAGDTATGITIMLMDEGMDTGPILRRSIVSLEGTETAGELTDRLAALGAQLLVDTLSQYLEGTCRPAPQDEALATLTRPVRTIDAVLSWQLPSGELERHVRAYNPHPGAWTMLNGHVFKVFRATIGHATDGQGKPGTLVAHAPAQRLGVLCGDRTVLLLDAVQPAGKRVLDGNAFFHGYQQLAGTVLG